jgi:protein involved in ribonucleotide reduction
VANQDKKTSGTLIFGHHTFAIYNFSPKKLISRKLNTPLFERVDLVGKSMGINNFQRQKR